MNPAISLKNVSLRVPVGFIPKPRRILDGVTFEVGTGQIHGLVGHNGAGKSTLFRLLMGMSRADEGEVVVLGYEPTHPRRPLVGYAPDMPSLPGSLTPQELVSAHVSLVGQTDDVLSAVGLSHSTNSRIGTLSKGMRQRLGLALALVGRPQVLLLDEPMSGLDPEGRWQVRELIRAQQSAGSTILFSSHVLTDVQDLCGAVTILDHGRVKFSGPLTTADALRHKVIFAAPASPPEGALPFALEVLEPGTFAVTIDAPERLAEVIPQLLASHGARLIQVHPIHLTLEERLRLVGRTP